MYSIAIARIIIHSSLLFKMYLAAFSAAWLAWMIIRGSDLLRTSCPCPAGCKAPLLRHPVFAEEGLKPALEVCGGIVDGFLGDSRFCTEESCAEFCNKFFF